MTAAELTLYFTLVLGIVLIPGMDMAFVVGHSLTGGLRAGGAALLGVVVGAFVHLTMGALGVALLLKAIPGAFTTMLLAGAAYLFWLGGQLMRAQPSDEPSAPVATRGSAFFGAMLTNLLNPKAYLFSLAVVPQFVHPERGSVAWQLGAIGLITAATQVAIYGGLAWVAARGQRQLAAAPMTQARLFKAVGLTLWITGGYAVWQALKSTT